MSLHYILPIMAMSLLVSGCNTVDEVPIVRAIGMDSATDVTSDRGIQSHREIVYLNKDKDPGFFSKIVERVEQSSTIKDLKCTKKPGRDMQGETLGLSGFSDDQITNSIIFRSQDSRFNCSISDGGEFILVIIYTT